MKKAEKQIATPQPPQPGYRLTWRTGQLIPVEHTDQENGNLRRGNITLNTNPDVPEVKIISKVELKDKGGQGVLEVFANESKCAVLEYNKHAHYWIEIGPKGRVSIAETGNTGPSRVDIKNKDLCEFVGKKVDKYHLQ